MKKEKDGVLGVQASESARLDRIFMTNPCQALPQVRSSSTKEDELDCLLQSSYSVGVSISTESLRTGTRKVGCICLLAAQCQ